MSDLTEQDRTRLVDYLDGRLNPDDRVAFEAWVSAEPARTREMARLRLAWNVASQTDRGTWTATPVFAERARVERRSKTPMRSAQRTSWRWVAGVGAAVGVVLLGARMLSIPAAEPGRSNAMETFATGAGQTANVTLRDGTHVVLAANTTLRIQRGDATNRTVVLDGEAYFDVTAMLDAPFRVQTGNVITRVLGTRFFVRRRATDVRTRVAVVSGKVLVTTPSKNLATVTAGAVAEAGDSTLTVNAVNPAGGEWVGEQLVFRHVAVTTVLETLRRWYGYQFRCADSTLAHQQVTFGVSMGSSAATLAALEQMLHVNLKVVGDTVTLTARPATRPNATPRVRAYDIWTPNREVGR